MLWEPVKNDGYEEMKNPRRLGKEGQDEEARERRRKRWKGRKRGKERREGEGGTRKGDRNNKRGEIKEKGKGGRKEDNERGKRANKAYKQLGLTLVFAKSIKRHEITNIKVPICKPNEKKQRIEYFMKYK